MAEPSATPDIVAAVARYQMLMPRMKSALLSRAVMCDAHIQIPEDNITCEKLVQCAKVIADCTFDKPVDSSLLEDLREILQFRRKCARYFERLARSRPSDAIIESNARHQAFIHVLEEVHRLLKQRFDRDLNPQPTFKGQKQKKKSNNYRQNLYSSLPVEQPAPWRIQATPVQDAPAVAKVKAQDPVLDTEASDLELRALWCIATLGDLTKAFRDIGTDFKKGRVHFDVLMSIFSDAVILGHDAVVHAFRTRGYFPLTLDQLSACCHIPIADIVESEGVKESGTETSLFLDGWSTAYMLAASVGFQTGLTPLSDPYPVGSQRIPTTWHPGITALLLAVRELRRGLPTNAMYDKIGCRDVFTRILLGIIDERVVHIGTAFVLHLYFELHDILRGDLEHGLRYLDMKRDHLLRNFSVENDYLENIAELSSLLKFIPQTRPLSHTQEWNVHDLTKDFGIDDEYLLGLFAFSLTLKPIPPVEPLGRAREWQIRYCLGAKEDLWVSETLLAVVPSLACQIVVDQNSLVGHRALRYLERCGGLNMLFIYQAMRHLPTKSLKSQWPDMDFIIACKQIRHTASIANADQTGTVLAQFLLAHGVPHHQVQAAKREGFSPDLSRAERPHIQLCTVYDKIVTKRDPKDYMIPSAQMTSAKPAQHKKKSSSQANRNYPYSDDKFSGINLHYWRQVYEEERHAHQFDYLPVVARIKHIFVRQVGAFMGQQKCWLNAANMTDMSACSAGYPRVVTQMLNAAFVYEHRGIGTLPYIYDLAAIVDNTFKSGMKLDFGNGSVNAVPAGLPSAAASSANRAKMKKLSSNLARVVGDNHTISPYLDHGTLTLGADLTDAVMIFETGHGIGKFWNVKLRKGAESWTPVSEAPPFHHLTVSLMLLVPHEAHDGKKKH